MGPGAEAPGRAGAASTSTRYLGFLTERGHNFIRLWRWEQFRSQAAGGNYHLDMTPQPWARTGPGTAKDGKPRFDLERFDEAFFDRLRERVVQAGEAGIYVGVMLFDGWALHLSPPPDHIEGHPFHAGNNVNGDRPPRRSTTSRCCRSTRTSRRSRRRTSRKVVDTLHDLPNVLWEVANESSGDGSVDQGVRRVPRHGRAAVVGRLDRVAVLGDRRRQAATRRDRGYDAAPDRDDDAVPGRRTRPRSTNRCCASRADWISPGYDDESFTDGRHPMAPGIAAVALVRRSAGRRTGRKVVISDTDHYAPGRGDALWAWKSFLRGHHPILMDFGLIAGLRRGRGVESGRRRGPFEAYEAARWAMGDTRRYAERMDLIRDGARDLTLSSTGYALANPGQEYLVLEPTGDGHDIRVELPAGRYDVEWFGINSRQSSEQRALQVDAVSSAPIRLAVPGEPAVLYLRVSSSAV